MWLYRRLVEPQHSRLAPAHLQSTPGDRQTDWQASYGWDKNVCSSSHKDEPLSSNYIDVHDR
jgi:hypothetical protein